MEERPHRLRQLVAAIADQEILVIGDIMLDRYLWGQVGRISPEAPVPVVDVISESCRPGGAANVAANLAALGARPLLCGVTGDDAHAHELRAKLDEDRIDVAAVETDPQRTTTVKNRIMAHGTQVVRVDREQRTPPAGPVRQRLRDRMAEALARVNAVIVSDYGKGLVDRELMEFLIAEKSPQCWLAVDPKDPTLELYRGASLVTPNLAEAGAAFGQPLSTEALVMQAGQEIQRRLQLQALLITRGEQGLSLFERNGGFTHFPTVALEVYDVTGAGDTVIAACTAALAAGGSLSEAAVLANQAAGVAVREVGTAAVTAEEILLSFEE